MRKPKAPLLERKFSLLLRLEKEMAELQLRWQRLLNRKVRVHKVRGQASKPWPR